MPHDNKLSNKSDSVKMNIWPDLGNGDSFQFGFPNDPLFVQACRPPYWH